MTGGEHEAIAVGPNAVFRIEAQHSVPERVHDRSHRHRRAGMPGVGLLYGIHTQRTHGVYAELVELFSVQRLLPKSDHTTRAFVASQTCKHNPNCASAESPVRS